MCSLVAAATLLFGAYQSNQTRKDQAGAEGRAERSAKEQQDALEAQRKEELERSKRKPMLFASDVTDNPLPPSRRSSLRLWDDGPMDTGTTPLTLGTNR